MFDKTKTHELLRGVRLFEGLDDAALRRISSQFKSYAFPAGASVIAEDSSGRFGRMYVVVSGTATARVHDDAVATYGPGDSFGEMSALDGQPRSAAVVADTDPDAVVNCAAMTAVDDCENAAERARAVNATAAVTSAAGIAAVPAAMGFVISDTGVVGAMRLLALPLALLALVLSYALYRAVR